MKFLRIILFYFLSLVNIFFPKNEKKVFFYDSTYRKDNLWALFCKLKKEKKDHKIIYFSKQIPDLEKEKNESDNILFVSSNLIGLYHHLTSKYIFTGFGAYRFMSKKTSSQCVVNLWHGSPLKSVGKLAGDDIWYPYKEVYSYTLSTSTFFESIMQEAFGYSKEESIISGLPRNDFLRNKVDLHAIWDVPENYKIVLWMPTFRKSTNTLTSDSDIDFPILTQDNIQQLNFRLKQLGIFLIIKPHPLQMSLSLFNINLSNILIIEDKDLNFYEIELYELVGNTDALITDYSSVYFDYMLLDRPIGFTIVDIQSYKENRGFSVEQPERIMPGSKIKSYQDLIVFFMDVANGVDLYKHERFRVNTVVNKYYANHCERILFKLGLGDDFGEY